MRKLMEDEVSPIQEDNAADQRIIPFEGDDLVAARTTQGVIYVSVAGLCSAIGLNTQGQTQRMRRTPTLARGLRIIPLESTRGIRHTICLRLDKVALWLAGVEPARLKPAAATKIEAYQEELAPVATEVFFGSLGRDLAPVTAAPDTNDVAAFLSEHVALTLAPQFEAMDSKLDYVITLLETLAGHQEEHAAKLAEVDARTDTLTPEHMHTIKRTIDRIIQACAANSPPVPYSFIYGRLKHRFRVTSYRDIKDSQFDIVITFLHEQQAELVQSPAQGELF
jgi:hypothetical protein